MNTLRLGSTGADVQTLQTGLNLLPSELLQLAVDGIFGPKTFERVKEYQALARIAVDGVVGPQTWNALQFVLGALGRIVTVNRLRDQVVSVAKKEAEGPGLAVHAKAPGAFDSNKRKHFRAGHTRLLEYFRKAAPDPSNFGKTIFNEEAICYLEKPNQLAPCPHWCGIFAVWAHKAANIPVGAWKLGGGISSVQGFHVTTVPKKGDVGYVGGQYQHMVLVERIYSVGSQIMVATIEGNSEPDSAIRKKQRTKAEILSFYTAF